VVLTNPVCDVFNPNAIRASRGTMFSLSIAVASPEAVLQLCVSRGIAVHTARVDGTVGLWQTNFQGACAIVFGSEAHGLDSAWPTPPCQSFQIPMHHATDSLNVSISAALTLYECVRQRQAARS
jgi:TrmH family RNA methyltransferase